MTAAALVFVALATLVIGFQLALVAGMPWGALTMGGKFPGQLPRRVRAVAAVSAALLAAFALLVAARAGLVLPAWAQMSRSAIWVVVAYCALGVLANAATPSPPERRLWLPVVTVMLVCSAFVATR